MFSELGRTLKDAALAKLLETVARSMLARYCEVRHLRVDSSRRRLEAEVCLLGETDPVRVSEAFYRVERVEDGSWAILYGLKISRAWAQNLVDDHFREIRVKLPAAAAAFVA